MILLVDDDPIFLRSAAQVLEKPNGMLFASNAIDALNLIKAIQFSVALVDLDLPDKSGFDLIQEMHATAPGMPIIAMSGVFSSTVLESAKEFGARDVLRKPATAQWTHLVSRYRVGE